jgi:hypothetical protein
MTAVFAWLWKSLSAFPASRDKQMGSGSESGKKWLTG